MHDIGRHVVLTETDEHFAAANPVTAIGMGLGARANRRKIRSRLGLGEVHGAAPFTTDQFGQVRALQRS